MLWTVEQFQGNNAWQLMILIFRSQRTLIRFQKFFRWQFAHAAAQKRVSNNYRRIVNAFLSPPCKRTDLFPLRGKIFTELFAIKINNRGKNTWPFGVPEFPWQIRLDQSVKSHPSPTSRALARNPHGVDEKSGAGYVPGQVCARIFTAVWEKAEKRVPTKGRPSVGRLDERKRHARLIFPMRSLARSTSISSGRELVTLRERVGEHGGRGTFEFMTVVNMLILRSHPRCWEGDFRRRDGIFRWVSLIPREALWASELHRQFNAMEHGKLLMKFDIYCLFSEHRQWRALVLSLVYATFW